VRHHEVFAQGQDQRHGQLGDTVRPPAGHESKRHAGGAYGVHVHMVIHPAELEDQPQCARPGQEPRVHRGGLHDDHLDPVDTAQTLPSSGIASSN
jgi:hypothetical protein